MFSLFTTKKQILDKKAKPKSSDFSDFFRKASSGEKKRVFTHVAKKASDMQRKYMHST